jgi:hypothetical protein
MADARTAAVLPSKSLAESGFDYDGPPGPSNAFADAPAPGADDYYDADAPYSELEMQDDEKLQDPVPMALVSETPDARTTALGPSESLAESGFDYDGPPGPSNAFVDAPAPGSDFYDADAPYSELEMQDDERLDDLAPTALDHEDTSGMPEEGAIDKPEEDPEEEAAGERA